MTPFSGPEFRIFFIFFCSGAGEREEVSEKVAGGPVFNLKQREVGGFPRRRRGRGKGTGGMSVGKGGGGGGD